MPYQVGQTIVQRFEIYRVETSPLQHRFSVAYLCHDHENQQARVLSGWHEEISAQANFAHHFKHSALAWCKLPTHPHIVKAHEVLSIGNKHFVTLNHTSPDINKRLKIADYFSKEVNLEHILRWSLAFCDALLFAQTHNLTPHKNIHPYCLLIDIDRQLQLCGLDLTSLRDNPTARQSKDFIQYLEQHAPWQAPEQFTGNSNEQSDLYSFGIILYQLCHAGQLPFKADATHDWQQCHRHADIPPLDTPIWPILQKLLAKKTFDRYGETKPQTAYSAFHDALSLLWHKQFPDKAVPITSLDRQYSEAIHAQQQGNALVAIKRPKQALEHHFQALSLSPDSALTLLHTGICYAELGEQKRAARYYKKSLLINPDLAEGFIRYAVLCDQSGLQSHAINAFSKALSLDPLQDIAKTYIEPFLNSTHPTLDIKKAQQFYDKAMTLWENQHITLAITQFEQCIQHNPKHGEAHYYVAGIYQEQQFIELAYCHYQTALTCHPPMLAAHYKMAHLLKNLGIFKEAADAFQTYLNMAGPSAEHLADARYQIPKMLSLEAQFQHQTIYPEAIFNRALSFLDLGRNEEAKDGFCIALQMRPAYPAAVDGLGQYFEKINERHNAMEYYKKALELDADLSLPWYHLGCLYYQENQQQASIEAFQQFIALAPEHQKSQREHSKILLQKMASSSIQQRKNPP